MAGEVLVTGANGFVGRAVRARLGARGAYRRSTDKLGPGDVVVGDIHGRTDWSSALESVDTVIHLAARVHVMHDIHADPLAAFRLVNVDGTLQLARQAADAGVRRLVFVSSIKVNGESTSGRPFRHDDAPHAVDPYGISKREAEEGLKRIGRETGMQTVVIRPPLVYGPGVGGNFRSMLQWLSRGLPTPFGAVDNRRSLVGLSNLVDFVGLCVRHPAAAGRTWLISDRDDVSTPELLRRAGSALGVRVRQLPVPVAWLRQVARMTGREPALQRLCDSLVVDADPAREVLGWRPVRTMAAELQDTADAFRHGAHA